VVYTLNNENELVIEYSATVDRATIINLTNHVYFNLHGDMSQNVLDHFVYIPADKVIESNEQLIPTGKVISVLGTPLDFIHSQKIGSRINDVFPGQLFPGKGYVVAYVLNQTDRPLKPAAKVLEKKSGRVLEVYTDQPCLQFYNAWLMDGTDTGKNGQQYHASAGLALETQAYPDAPNHSCFPSIVLKPEETYRQKTIYRFSVD
jgi:aldose 1-epimerase